MKGLVFAVAVALACCVTTCAALKCPTCDQVGTRAACLQSRQATCNQTAAETYCYTVTAKAPGIAQQWTSRCGTKQQCDAGKIVNVNACKPATNSSACIACCNTDGCVAQPDTTGASAAVSVSVITMATAVMAVLLKNAAGF
ncbi:PREDICTED: uncharacterized protein LOC109484614 isoform X1 [Branchiostoma belcheri]|uniref:Uncharacterized protein LOC109484614 isoform X1 n=1 Tax=Branchiostoma belcheri TaxID=7741 RepID=A0A6P5AKA0_BRABE|nr:PREDICTED: uncharacterized protein LOC109484614 isoform X1 [Branchiostoma belcheri]